MVKDKYLEDINLQIDENDNSLYKTAEESGYDSQLVDKIEASINEKNPNAYVTKKFKEFTNKDLEKIFGDILSELDEKIKEDYKNILNSDVVQYASEGRPVPQYAVGFLAKPFLENGIPVRDKDLAVYKAVMSGDFSLVEVEGGVRGGKDVILLYCWAKYLMICPDKLHLALGSSLEHVLRTVLMSDGFGLFYTIPHGIFIRESISGAQRGVYKFQDAYGFEKVILFYGNENQNDGNKFQGFTIGSVYVNETLNQHLNGLEQAVNRMASVKWPLMLMTQNPKGANHPYYQKFERAKLADEENMELMEFISKEYKEEFSKLEEVILEKRLNEMKLKQKAFIQSKNKTSKKMLSSSEHLDLQKMLLNISYKYDKMIRSFPVQKFFEHLHDKHYLYGKSMKKVINYFRGEKNANNISNAYDFAYFHYTVEDNMIMDDMQRNDFKNKRIKGTATYDQEVLGIRRTSEGAVFPHFGERNILRGSLDYYYFDGKFRMIVIDKGYSHPTGITDWFFDYTLGTGDCLQERPIDFNKEFPHNKSPEVIYKEVVQLVRNLNSRKVDAIVIDPSAPELIQMFSDRGWNVMPANNSYWRQKGEDREDANIINDKDLIGIDLLSLAMSRGKLKIHENCIETIRQVESYAYVGADKSSKVKLQDLDDDQMDTVRYAWNTSGISPSFWGESDGDELNEQGSIREDESKKNEEWDMESILQRQFEQSYDDGLSFNFGNEDDDGWFNSNGNGWFN